MIPKELVEQFQSWQAEAEKAGNPDKTAMNLSTVSADGRPSSRVVLLKALDERGFVFYTNLTSRKGQELGGNPFVALCFNWMEVEKQVRVEGRVEPVSDEEADAYFASRAKQSQVGAWASKQSQVIEGALDFEKRIAKYGAKYALGKVPRPEFWSGFRVIPDRIEFWHARSFRLHERKVYKLGEGGQWRDEKLYP